EESARGGAIARTATQNTDAVAAIAVRPTVHLALPVMLSGVSAVVMCTVPLQGEPSGSARAADRAVGDSCPVEAHNRAARVIARSACGSSTLSGKTARWAPKHATALQGLAMLHATAWLKIGGSTHAGFALRTVSFTSPAPRPWGKRMR